MSLTQTATGWTFTHGTQTYGPYSSREQAAEALYDAERGKALPTTFARKREIFRQFDEIFGLTDDADEKRTGDDVPFGALADGTPIMGVFDAHEPGGRSGLVHAEVGGCRVSAQDEPNLISIQGDGYDLNDVTIDELNALRAVLATDAPEQLLATAIAHSRGDAAPPALTAAASIVTYQLTQFDDGSGEPWDEYHCGDASLAICGNNHKGDLMLYCAGAEIGPLSTQDLRDLSALLSDPRARIAAKLAA